MWQLPNLVRASVKVRHLPNLIDLRFPNVWLSPNLFYHNIDFPSTPAKEYSWLIFIRQSNCLTFQFTGDFTSLTEKLFILGEGNDTKIIQFGLAVPIQCLVRATYLRILKIVKSRAKNDSMASTSHLKVQNNM